MNCLGGVKVWFANLCLPNSSSSKKGLDQWILTAPESVEPGAEVVVSWTWQGPDGLPNPAWIGLYQTNSSERDYIEYQDLEGQEGTISFSSNMLLEGGKEYEVRIYACDYEGGRNEEYILKARSRSFVLGTWSVSVPPRIEQGIEIGVKYTAPCNFGSAWIGIYRASASDEDCLQWSWVKGNEGQLAFKAAGMKSDYAYEARIFQDDGKTGYSFKARSDIFAVLAR